MAEPLRRRNALHTYTVKGGGVNMAPMVDVVLVILIFFMAATKFAGQEWLLQSGSAHAAQPQTTPAINLPGVTLSLHITDQDNTLTATVQGTQHMPLTQLPTWLATFTQGIDPAKVAVVIDAEPTTPWDALVTAHEACLAVNIHRIAITQ